MDAAKLRALYEEHVRIVEAGYAKALQASGFDAVVQAVQGLGIAPALLTSVCARLRFVKASIALRSSSE